MCGIAGLIGGERLLEDHRNNLLKRMKNRGPDSQQYIHLNFKNRKNIEFFFSRLSIIDVNPRSNQPYTKYNKTLIFNGEIYNYLELKNKLSAHYSFDTKSDTEVLLTAYHHYGINFTDHLEGMWALAIFDETENKIILSRDRFGEKPLYYLDDKNQFIFGSEINYIREILGKKLEVNYEKLNNFLVYGYRTIFSTESTFFKKIKPFPKSETWEINQSSKIINRHCYWKVNYRENKNISYVDVVDKTEELITNSIQKRLRSDVKLGISLSGGIDSSLIFSIAKSKFNQEMDTFSIIDKDPRYNENENIKSLIEKYNVKNSYEINIKDYNFLDDLKKLVQYHCSPVFTISSYINSLISRKALEEKNRVILSGIGGDELFLGYYYHYLYWLYDKFQINDDYKNHVLEWQQKTGSYVNNPLIKDVENFINNPSSRDHLFNDTDFFASLLLKKNIENSYYEENYHNNLLRNRMLNDLFKDVVPVVLNQEDLNYMFNSTENRCPFLDKDLTEFAYTIPNKYLIRNGYTKSVLREIGNKYLPNKINYDLEKKGFNASIETLFDLNNTSNLEFCLDDGPIYEIFDRQKIEKFLKSDFHSNSFSKFLFIFISTKMFLENV
tara:strand:- start:30872 stop:32704 length:1833 start_codon:yes stop_codon:yes gene_type:complete